jgi:BlaI family transcriptional regulator, penicillinase repressor
MIEKTIKPTESELEILQVLWEKNSATVREVHDVLGKRKDVGYTTTLKLMQIMHEKAMVVRDKSTKTHVYKSLVSKESTQQQMVNKLVNTLFNGSTTELVMNALGTQTPSATDIEALEQYLQQFKK